MTRLIIPALVALLVSGMAGDGYAKDGEHLPNFKQLCISDVAVHTPHIVFQHWTNIRSVANELLIEIKLKGDRVRLLIR